MLLAVKKKLNFIYALEAGIECPYDLFRQLIMSVRPNIQYTCTVTKMDMCSMSAAPIVH